MSKDGTVEDWDTAAKLWEYAITSRLTNAKPGNPMSNGLNDADNNNMEVDMEGVQDQEKSLEENPLLMTETGWNSGKGREKGIEIAMESWGCPAFWLARNGVLAAYVGVSDTPLGACTVTKPYNKFRCRKGDSSCRRHRSRQCLSNPSARRPDPQERRRPLPTGWQLRLPAAPPPVLHLSASCAPHTSLPRQLKDARRRWRTRARDL